MSEPIYQRRDGMTPQAISFYVGAPIVLGLFLFGAWDLVMRKNFRGMIIIAAACILSSAWANLTQALAQHHRVASPSERSEP